MHPDQFLLSYSHHIHTAPPTRMVIPNPVIDNEPEPDIRSHTHHGSTPHNNINTPASQPPSPLIVPGPRHSVPSTIMSDDDRDDADTPNKDPTPWQSFKVSGERRGPRISEATC